jgi:hypothetical protein
MTNKFDLPAAQIRAAEELAKIPGMDRAPHCLNDSIGRGRSRILVQASTLLLRYLKIEDGLPWSSAAILVGLGFRLRERSDGWAYIPRIDIGGVGHKFATFEECPPEYQELANVLAIIELYRQDLKNGTTFVIDYIRGLG